MKNTSRGDLASETGLPFLPADDAYRPWRNYSRVFKLSLICADSHDSSISTDIASLLALDGDITTDEYMHFLASASTDPSPALTGWDHLKPQRYPLLFVLKFLLAKTAMGILTSDITDIVAAYQSSELTGDEGQSEFIELFNNHQSLTTEQIRTAAFRQSAESIRVIGQISYLSISGREVSVSLSKEDAQDIFEQLQPLGGSSLKDGAEEILRRTSLFNASNAEMNFDYSESAITSVEDSGFSGATTYAEGARARKTHLVIERNRKIRQVFFQTHPTTVCDICDLDTSKRYPWAGRILDVHHLLPLCSGARTSAKGTILDDLVAVCPTCHRGVHRFYDQWLRKIGKKDFIDADQARYVYAKAKESYQPHEPASIPDLK